MVKKRGVTMLVDEDFFKIFENERKLEQDKLRRKLGGVFNLTQRNFTGILAAKKVRFQIPKQRSVRTIGRRPKKRR